MAAREDATGSPPGKLNEAASCRTGLIFAPRQTLALSYLIVRHGHRDGPETTGRCTGAG